MLFKTRYSRQKLDIRAPKPVPFKNAPKHVYFVVYEFMDGVFRSEVALSGGQVKTYLWSPWRESGEMWDVTEFVSTFQMDEIKKEFKRKYGFEIL